MKNIFCIVIILVSFTEIGCEVKKDKVRQTINNPKEKAASPIAIHLPDKVDGDLTTSMIAGEVKYIPLETTKNSFLGNINKIRMNDSVIVISDRQKLLLFGRDGTFIRQIGTNGKGPGEYILIFDFELYGDTIYFSTTGKKSIIRYSLDGKFIDELMPVHQLSHFAIDPKGQIVSYDHIKDELQVYNRSMKLTNKFSPDNLEVIRGAFVVWDDFNTYFQISDNKLLFTSYYNDTIWDISGGNKKAAYVFDLKDKLFNRDVVVKLDRDGDFNAFYKAGAKKQKINILENETKLFVFQKTWATDELNSIYIHDFSSRITKRYTGSFITDDLVSGIKLKIVSEFQCSSNSIISFIYPIDLPEKLEELDKKGTQNLPEAYSAWKNRMQHVKIDDNPVIVIMKLK